MEDPCNLLRTRPFMQQESVPPKICGHSCHVRQRRRCRPRRHCVATHRLATWVFRLVLIVSFVQATVAQESPSNLDADADTSDGHREHAKNKNAHENTKVAIVTLLTTAVYVPGALVLAESLQQVQATGERVLLWVGPEDDPRSDLTRDHLDQLTSNNYWQRTIQLTQNDGTFTPCQLSAEQQKLIAENPTLEGLDRYWGTCSKFALWSLTDYDVVVYMDADSFALHNFDFVATFLQQHNTAFAAHGVPECWPNEITRERPTCDNFYTALMVLKPMPNVQPYFHQLAQQQYLAEGEITFLNHVIQQWEPLPRFTLVAQTETVRPLNKDFVPDPQFPKQTFQVDWNAVAIYDFSGQPQTKPWYIYQLQQQTGNPQAHSYFGMVPKHSDVHQRYMIPQHLWNRLYSQVLQKLPHDRNDDAKDEL